MATIIPTIVEEQVRAAAFRWTDYSTADTSTSIKVQNMQGLAGSVQVTGTFGGATIALQVSNDGTNYVTLKDGSGVAITFTAAGVAEFSTAALFIKPTSSGGTDDNVTVTIVLRG
jgi:P pilus assembly chaperone PapD